MLHMALVLQARPWIAVTTCDQGACFNAMHVGLSLFWRLEHLLLDALVPALVTRISVWPQQPAGHVKCRLVRSGRYSTANLSFPVLDL